MAEEKILQDEVMDAEELEGVVGGYYDTWNDYKNFQALGGGFYKGRYSIEGVEQAFENVGKYLGIRIQASVCYDKTPGITPNRYSIEGKLISRDELWSIIREGVAAQKK